MNVQIPDLTEEQHDAIAYQLDKPARVFVSEEEIQGWLQNRLKKEIAKVVGGFRVATMKVVITDTIELTPEDRIAIAWCACPDRFRLLKKPANPDEVQQYFKKCLRFYLELAVDQFLDDYREEVEKDRAKQLLFPFMMEKTNKRKGSQ